MLLCTIQEQIDEFLLISPENRLPDLGMVNIYDRPLIGVASARDVLWDRLKEPEVVGPQHMSPAEWLPGAVTVISFFLPFTQRIRSANRTEGWPAAEWLYGRYEGEILSNALRRFMVGVLERGGSRAISPVLDPRFAKANFRSNWSERHVAFIAGLGTFSLNRSLITRLGSAGRFASVITGLALEPTPRPYTEADEYCTKCGACIRRCPPAAIAENGKNNAVCYPFLQETLLRHAPRYGCGKCQTAVPCEAQIPKPDGVRHKLP